MTSHPTWNQETDGFEIAEAFAQHIRGKTVLITGVSPESIGFSTALAIASQAPSLLLLASRTPAKLAQTQASIIDVYPDVNIKIVLLDLMSQASVRKTAAEVSSIITKLDVLINNAGSMTPRLEYTKEGLESQFGSNHIGHFQLTRELLPLLRNAAQLNPPGATRVVNLTSLAHRLSPFRFHDYNFEGHRLPEEEQPAARSNPAFRPREGEVYNGFIAYSQAKTASILFSVALSEKLNKEGIMSYAVHPGSIWTGLVRNLDAEGETAIRGTSSFWKTHDQGAATTLVAAFDPALNESQGVLLHDCQYFEAASHATDPGTAERLWELSSKLVGLDVEP